MFACLYVLMNTNFICRTITRNWGQGGRSLKRRKIQWPEYSMWFSSTTYAHFFFFRIINLGRQATVNRKLWNFHWESPITINSDYSSPCMLSPYLQAQQCDKRLQVLPQPVSTFRLCLCLSLWIGELKHQLTCYLGIYLCSGLLFS